MIVSLLLLLMILLYTAQSLLTRLYSEHYPGQANMASPVFNVISGVVVMFSALVMCGFRFDASWQTLLLGVANGLAFVLYSITIIKASQTGPYSVLMIFLIAGGILFPTFTGSVIFGDDFTLVKAICILVILASVYFVSSKKDDAAPQKGFWLACAGLALGNGLYSAFLDMQQRLTSVDEKEEMIAVTFFVVVTLSAAILLINQKKNFFAVMKQSKKSLIYLLSCAVVMAAAIHTLTGMISMMDLTLLFTFDNSGVFLISVVASCVFFKEKLSTKNVIGCITMSVALVVMMGWDWIITWFA